MRRLEPATGHTAPALLNWPDTTLRRGSPWTFHPVLTSGRKFDAKLLGKTTGLSVDISTGTVFLLVPAEFFEALQLLNLQVPGPSSSASTYPILLHTDGLELPFAAPPAAKLAATGQRGPGLAMLGASSRDFTRSRRRSTASPSG